MTERLAGRTRPSVAVAATAETVGWAAERARSLAADADVTVVEARRSDVAVTPVYLAESYAIVFSPGLLSLRCMCRTR